MTETKLNLEQLYNESIKLIREGEIITGKIVSIKNKEVFVDVGFKSEGLVAAHEFNQEDLTIGKELDFLIESLENDHGIMMLSREKVTRMQGWDKIIKNSKENDLIEGTVSRKVKGGFLADVNGIEGFLPASLSAFKGMFEKDILGKQFKFKIIKINNLRRSIILSRRDAVQKEKEEARAKIWLEIKIGGIHTGTVKAITDFGAFVDLGGVDGLLHITDMSWSKISHPSEVVAIGDKIEVMVLNFDKEANKVSLGLKQRFPDPWQDVDTKYKAGDKLKGKIVNILPYGVFVELEKGIEGLIHVSEVSWSKRVTNLGELFAVGDTVETQVLNVDRDARRISLSVKHLEQNPWVDAEAKYPAGTRIQGKVRGFTDYGAFIELDGNLEGMIHISDMSWTKRISHPQDLLKKGQKVDVVILSVDIQSHRITLGLKQLQDNPWPEIASKYPLETVLEAEVVTINDFGVFVKIEEDLEGLVYANEIDKEVSSQLKVGDKLQVKIIKVDTEQGKIGLTSKV